ncbi:MAG: metalloregulator ArsR/SmtB family transcription factor [Patescibacteria group bacterium]
MVECTLNLDSIFGSLADPTRRDILKRLMKKEEMSVTEVAKPYKMTFAAISKHLQILEKAKLVIKQRFGKQQVVQLSPTTLKEANDYLGTYKKLWEDRFDALDDYLNNTK